MGAVHRVKLSKHQMQAMQATQRMVFMGCGVGAGKTFLGTLWGLRKMRQNPDALGLICANSYPQLIDSTLRAFYRQCAEWGIVLDPPQLPRSHRPFSLWVDMGDTQTEVLCRSLDKKAYQQLSGLEVGWWWADETFQTLKAAIDLLMARLRDANAGDQLQGLMTTTLDDPTTWMYDMVVDKHNPELMAVIYATTMANAHNLPPGYIEALKSFYSKRMYDRMVLAKWVSLEEGQIYHAFNRELHEDSSIQYQEGLQVRWAHDFNVGSGKPMSSCLAQFSRRAGVMCCDVFDEIVIDSINTQDTADEFKSRYPNINPQQVIIYGDAAGRHNDSRSNQTDYTLLESAGFVYQDVPRKNPPLRDRHNAVNTLLCNADGLVRLRIHPRCKNLLKGLETVTLKSGANYLEQETREQHVTTALGYMVHIAFPCQPPKRTDSKPRNWK